MALYLLGCGTPPATTSTELDEIETHLSETMKLAVRIALVTGMRRGEIAEIKASDLLRAGCSLVVPEAKNGKRRVVPLPEPTCTLLYEHLLLNRDRFGVRADSITQAFIRACRKASISDLRFHDLRHEAITRMFEAGLSVPRVSAISGHTDYRMLARYTHLA